MAVLTAPSGRPKDKRFRLVFIVAFRGQGQHTLTSESDTLLLANAVFDSWNNWGELDQNTAVWKIELFDRGELIRSADYKGFMLYDPPEPLS